MKRYKVAFTFTESNQVKSGVSYVKAISRSEAQTKFETSCFWLGIQVKEIQFISPVK